MAESAAQLIAGLLGDALIAILESNQRRSFDRARAVWGWLQDAAAAPPGLELVAPDGAAYTGVVVIERSRAVLMVALRHRPERHRAPSGVRTAGDDAPGLFEEVGWWDEDGPPEG